MIETPVAKREEYFATLYDEITYWARFQGMTPLVSFLPQRIRRWGQDLALDLDRGGIWGKDDLTFGLSLGSWHDIKKLNFGAYPFSPELVRGGLSPEVLAFMVSPANLMSGEFKSYFPGETVDINCWANSYIFGGDNLDGKNPYTLISIVDRTIRQGRR